MKKICKKNSFTLIEIIVVVIIIGVIMTFAIPNLMTALEKNRLVEGNHTLTALLGAQKRYFFDNNQYTNNLTALDVEIPNSQFFNTPTVSSNTTSLVQLERKNSYKLSINDAGKISCTDNNAPAGTCKKLGF